MNSNRTQWRLGFGHLILGMVFLSGAGCTMQKTQDAKAPEVDVDVEPGRWPKYEVNWADIDVGTTTRTVKVPKIRVSTEQEEIAVPYISINPPGGRDVEERTVGVDLDVPDSGYSLDIREIRAARDTLWVIAELTQTGNGGRNRNPTRLSDRVVINAPDDLNVRKVIVGQRPEGVYNAQYTFVNDRSALDKRMPQGARVIYSKSGATSAKN